MSVKKAGATPEGTAGDIAALAPDKPESTTIPLRNREAEEPRGRWENRCDFGWNIDGPMSLICDRPTGHKGLHRGRLIETGYGKRPTVVGYGARR